MDIRSLIDGVVKLAGIASNVIPGAGLVANGAAIGGKIIDIIDGLQESADPDQQAEMKVARKQLSDAVKAKAAATSARLRG
ncbi:MAG: hypothetical protein V4696_00795 [Pseudomonadota bacterium]